MKPIAITLALVGIVACMRSSSPPVASDVTTTSAQTNTTTTSAHATRHANANAAADDRTSHTAMSRGGEASDSAGGGSGAIGRHPFERTAPPRPVSTGDPPPR